MYAHLYVYMYIYDLTELLDLPLNANEPIIVFLIRANVLQSLRNEQRRRRRKGLHIDGRAARSGDEKTLSQFYLTAKVKGRVHA